MANCSNSSWLGSIPRKPMRLAHGRQAVSDRYLVVEPLERRAMLAGLDFDIDFAAAAPNTYDHATGGGAYDDRTVRNSDDIVESLEGGNFQCGDVVTHLVRIQVANSATGSQTIDVDLSCLGNTTGQSGAGFGEIVNVGINYGPVAGGDGVGGTDSAINDDAGTTAVSRAQHGCTPGFWKNNWDHKDGTAWPDGVNGDGWTLLDIGIQDTDREGDATTLIDALHARGGGQSALIRHAVAAWLNAASPLVSYPLSTEEIVDSVNEALGSDEPQDVIDELADNNELGCSVDQRGRSKDDKPADDEADSGDDATADDDATHSDDDSSASNDTDDQVDTVEGDADDGDTDDDGEHPGKPGEVGRRQTSRGPGFWKSNWDKKGGVDWPTLDGVQVDGASTTLSAIGLTGFTILDGDETSLAAALGARGGDEAAVMRHSVAAWLNEQVASDFSVHGQTVSEAVHEALLSGDVGDLKDRLIDINEGGYGRRLEARPDAGDANEDEHFDAKDIVLVLQSGKYGTKSKGRADWSEGDWNGDGWFDRNDVILALQQGWYGKGPKRVGEAATDVVFGDRDSDVFAPPGLAVSGKKKSS